MRLELMLGGVTPSGVLGKGRLATDENEEPADMHPDGNSSPLAVFSLAVQHSATMCRRGWLRFYNV